MKNLLKPVLLLIVLVGMSATGLKAQTINGVLTADPQSLSFDTIVGSPQTKTVHISVLDVDHLARLFSSLIVVEIRGTNANQFSIDSNDQNIIDIVNSLLNGHPIDIPVTYNPTSTGYHYGTLVVKLPGLLGLDIILLNVNLTGHASINP